ncbi:MAG: tRNA dihydrouridine synthase DusB [Magnetococcales bacterium]|nr:tRNA dihydrouridine synthase DusB [Magnetococcales bacterium]
MAQDPIESLLALNRPLLILAPMAGITDAPCRHQARLLGADVAVSEMIASQSMIRHTFRSRQIARRCSDEYPLMVQIAGDDPQVMAEAARINVDRGADIIDINMGCPVKKAVRSGSGAVLMRNESLAAAIMSAVVKAVPVPVTVKIRTGWDDQNRNGCQIARIAQESGIRWVAIHGRTRAQLYQGRADWDYIARVKQQLSIPVIGNGDIRTATDAAIALATSGVDGVMIGRATLGNPWLFHQMSQALFHGRSADPPSVADRYQVISNHLQDMETFHPARTAHLLARKQLCWYTRGLPDSALLREQVNQSQDMAHLRALIERFFQPLLEQQP